MEISVREEKELAMALGCWMKRYGECIYGCDYAGWDKQDWGYYTRKGQEVYMVVFNRPYLGLLKVKGSQRYRNRKSRFARWTGGKGN